MLATTATDDYPPRPDSDLCDYFTVPDFRRLLSPGLSLTGSFQLGRMKWQV